MKSSLIQRTTEAKWTGPLANEARGRLAQLLAAGLARYLRASDGNSLTPPPTVCLYDRHGAKDEAADG